MKIKTVLDIADINSDIQSFVKWRITYSCNYKCSYCAQNQCNKRGANLHTDKVKSNKAVSEVNRIIEELPGNVKLELIGGEVSLLNVKSLLEKITSPKLKKVHMVTNFSKDNEYYYDIIQYLGSRNIEIELVCSYHYEHIKLEDFISKVRSLRAMCKDINITIMTETPCVLENIEECKNFQKECEKYKIPYTIDKDVRKFHLNKSLFSASTWKHSRYVVERYDGTKEIIYRRNDLLNVVNPAFHRLLVGPQYYCTRDVNFVYIYGDEVAGNMYGDSCKGLVPIHKYHPHKRLTKCVYAECTFCGRMSISKDPQVLLNYLQKYTLPDELK